MSRSIEISNLVREAAEQGVFLSAEGGELRFKLAVEEFPPALRSRIVERKPELIAFLLGMQTPESQFKLRRADGADEVVVGSPGQHRLWLLDKLGAGASYNMPAVLQVRGELDPIAAERALRSILERHEPLRTSFAEGEDGPVLRLQDGIGSLFRRIDMSGDGEDALSAAIKAEGLRAFDLERGPLLRAVHLVTGPGHGVLLLTLHHIAADGWSLKLLAEEFAGFYRAERDGRPHGLAEPQLRYSDYAASVRDWLATSSAETQRAYWRKRLAGLASTARVPTDRQVGDGRLGHAERVGFTVPAAVARELREIARINRCSVFMVLHAIATVLVSRYANSDDVAVATTVANRRHKSVEGLIGFFVNTLVLRTRPRHDLVFGDYLREVRDVHLDAQANQDLPFDQVMALMGPDRRSATAPFQLMFSYESDAPAARVDLGDATLFHVQEAPGEAKFELLLVARDSEDSIRIDLDYATSCFDARTAASLVGGLQRLVVAVAGDPQERLHRFSVLSTEEHDGLLALAGGDLPFDAEATLHGRFARQAALTP
ncbi:condensation domain-containing protein, partial [Marilutibacter maris]|uniref:condensation domain-containing protein n=1 Tax=Marilutibacter maris TaxID=1605891 RepID=UPI001B8747FA